ncbi:hypothetical protein QAD02_001849 [Eretmocerus hayati]|uniref:Uncharacterized protein n=1 Tax=Eretmocerus hayati TaxID=131215 RepID=A0ACC2NM13_9HYME|nr:hypothetical protein QAD02_001849 [Eretmocerus hayati]
MQRPRKIIRRIYRQPELSPFQKAVAEIAAKLGNPIQFNEYGHTALHTASILGEFMKVQRLIKCGANVDEQTLHDCKTPLHLALRNGNIECIDLFLEHGCNVNLQDQFGYSPLFMLMMAPISNKLTLKYMNLILEAGADVGLLSHSGRSILDCALTGKATDVSLTLVKHIAEKAFRGVPFADNIMYTIRNNEPIRNAFDDYTRELKAMSQEIIHDGVTVYDFISKDQSVLAKYLCNKKLAGKFKTRQYRIKFPVFFPMLRKSYLSAMEIRDSLKPASNALSKILSFVNHDHLIISEVMKYLDGKDIKNLAIMHSMHQFTLMYNQAKKSIQV